MLIARHRRSRALGKATEAKNSMGDNSNAAAFDRMKSKVQFTEATAQAAAELGGDDDVNERFAAMEKEQEIDRLLRDLKTKRNG